MKITEIENTYLLTLHRENEPAYIKSTGSETWWINGKRHRKNGPAVIISDGTKYWFKNGEIIKSESN